MDVSKGSKIFCRTLGPAALGWGHEEPLQTRLSPACVTRPNLIVLGQTREIPGKWAPCIPPLTVTESHRNRHRLLMTFYYWSVVTIGLVSVKIHKIFQSVPLGIL